MSHNVLWYKHKLEQLCAEVNDSITELKLLGERLGEEVDNGIPLQELAVTYTEHMAHSNTPNVVRELHDLAGQIRDDNTINDMECIREDLNKANSLALRVCARIFEISSMLAGAR